MTVIGSYVNFSAVLLSILVDVLKPCPILEMHRNPVIDKEGGFATLSFSRANTPICSLLTFPQIQSPVSLIRLDVSSFIDGFASSGWL